MRRSTLVTLLLLSATAALGCAPAATFSGSGDLTATTRQLAPGVFEVVIPRVEDSPGTKYAIPLPTELLPFAERNGSMRGIGTAFAISPTRFVSAAHVLPLVGTPSETFYLRDPSGGTHEVGRIVKYSRYRDLVEFELLSPMPGVVPLVPRTEVEIGEPVFTVGNASGEGVVVRGGTLTSRTPEPVNGAWSYLRFTAPASPGNSGGPLVDARGRVVGVVVQKNASENLNLAVPIGELTVLSTEKSDFGVKGVLFNEDGKEMLGDWAGTAPLPDTLARLRAAAETSLDTFYAAKLREFDAKFHAEIFPEAPRLAAFLTHPVLGSGLGMLTVDGTGTWASTTPKYTSKPLASGNYAEFAESPDHTHGEIMLARPAGFSLARFFESPRLLADALIANYEWSLTFAGRPIRLVSLGDPASSERWLDDSGRPWFSFVWPLRRSGEVLMLDCLTNPGGWACRWLKVPAGREHLIALGTKRVARRTTFAYFGLVRDWTEFFTLPERYRPPVFAGSSLALAGALSFDVAPFAGQLDLAEWSPTSHLDVYVAPDPSAPRRQRVVSLEFRPLTTLRSFSLAALDVLEPVDVAHEGLGVAWEKMAASKPPFDGSVRVENGLQTIERTIGIAPPGPRAVFLARCQSRADEKAVDLRALCTKFEEGLRVR